MEWTYSWLTVQRGPKERTACMFVQNFGTESRTFRCELISYDLRECSTVCDLPFRHTIQITTSIIRQHKEAKKSAPKCVTFWPTLYIS